MNYYLNQLPREILDYIITLTYKPQPEKLLRDIKSFHETKQRIKHFYSITMSSFNETEDEAVSWVVNNLLNEMNSDLPMILGFSKRMEEILLRSNLISTSEDIDLYFFVLLKKPAITQLNIILGLLNPYERCVLDYSLSAHPYENE
jgi:hypothetical protein